MPQAAREFDVVVLGAGAAGLMCAATAGQRGRRVALLEHGGQPGRKILISGGGRCNFTNLHCGPGNFLSNNKHFAKSALAGYEPRHFIELVDRYGIRWHEKTLGQLFCDGSARAILDMLLAECALGGVELVLNARGIFIERESAGGFRVSCSAGEFAASAVVVATGGLSIAKMGATGLAYEIAAQFGLNVVTPRPGLVPLVLGGDEARWTELAGVAAEAVAWVEQDPASGAKAHRPHAGSIVGVNQVAEKLPVAGAIPEKHTSGAEARADSIAFAPGINPRPTARTSFSAACKTPTYQPVPFKEKMLVTHRGLSGPAVLQASSYWRPGDELVLDLVPDSRPDSGMPAGVVSPLLKPRARRDAVALRQALREVLPQRLAAFLAETNGPAGWSNAALDEYERRLHSWRLHPAGTEGFEKAEVTVGGVDTDGLHARTMEAREAPGLYFIGEAVDVTGWLGGFNFQWAWASAVAAGKAC